MHQAGLERDREDLRVLVGERYENGDLDGSGNHLAADRRVGGNQPAAVESEHVGCGGRESGSRSHDYSAIGLLGVKVVVPAETVVSLMLPLLDEI